MEEEIHLAKEKGEISIDVRQLHFSEAGTSTESIPNAPPPPEKPGNRSEGKILKYIPPFMKDGVLTVIIEEDDIRQQVEIWESSLIGYV